MNKVQYRIARKLVRENGTFAYKWLDPHAKSIFVSLEAGHDELKTREIFLRAYTYCDGTSRKYDPSPRKIPALKRMMQTREHAF